MKTEIELKPCPFCGGKAELKQDMRYPRSGKYAGMSVKAYEAICPNSDCIIYNADNKYFFTREEAAEAWNRRSPDWISVRGKLPEKETPDYSVDVLVTDGVHVKIGYYDDSLGVWDAEYEELYEADISHWMPLPEPPEGASES